MDGNHGESTFLITITDAVVLVQAEVRICAGIDPQFERKTAG